MKRTLVAAAMMMVASAGAQAQDIKTYAGLGIGAFGLEYKDSVISQRKTTFGGYGKYGVELNDYVALELRVGATSFGKKSYPAGTLGASAGTFKTSADYFISYLARFQTPVADDFNVYALAGGTTAKFNVSNSATALSATKVKSGFSYGFGGDYVLGNQFSVGAEWVQYWTNVKLGSTFAPSPGTSSQVKLWGAVGTLNYAF